MPLTPTEIVLSKVPGSAVGSQMKKPSLVRESGDEKPRSELALANEPC